jgi:hypothetical protein
VAEIQSSDQDWAARVAALPRLNLDWLPDVQELWWRSFNALWAEAKFLARWDESQTTSFLTDVQIAPRGGKPIIYRMTERQSAQEGK